MAAALAGEIRALEKVLFEMPEGGRGVPQALLDCAERHSSLESDGIEELPDGACPKAAAAPVIVLDE